MSDAITSTKTGTDGGNILGQPMLFECTGICVLSPAHESEMRGLPCLCADFKMDFFKHF